MNKITILKILSKKLYYTFFILLAFTIFFNFSNCTNLSNKHFDNSDGLHSNKNYDEFLNNNNSGGLHEGDFSGTVFSGFQKNYSNIITFENKELITAQSIRKKIEDLRVKKNLPSSIQDLTNQNIPPRYDVLVYKIIYPVTYPKIGQQKAKTYTQSALILVPTLNNTNADKENTGWAQKNNPYNNIGEGPFPLLYRSHDLIFNNDDAPTVCDYKSNTKLCEAQLGILEAAQGFIVVMPDYLGFGESKDATLHPFLYPDYYQYEAETLLNIISNPGINEQNRQLVQSLKLNIKKRKTDNKQFLFLGGNSEGGFATLAIQKYLENSGVDYPYFIAASAPISPPANLNLTMQRILGRDFYKNPAFLLNLYFTYKNINNWDYKNEDLFYNGENYNNKFVNYGDEGFLEISSKNKNRNEINQSISDPNFYYNTPPNPYEDGRIINNPGKGDIIPITSILKPNFTDLWVNTNEAKKKHCGFY